MPSTRPFCCSWVPRCWISWCIWTRSSNVVGICSGSWIGFENPEHDKLHHPHLWAKWLSCCPLVWRWYWRKSAMEDRYHHTVPHVVDHRWYNCTQERCPHTTLQTKETIVAHWCHHEIDPLSSIYYLDPMEPTPSHLMLDRNGVWFSQVSELQQYCVFLI